MLHPGLYRVCYVFLTTDNVLDMYNPPAGNSACPPNARAQSPTATPAIRAEITRVVGEAKQQLPVLVVGEAQHLRNDILEDLRLLILAFLHDLTDAFASQYFPQVRRNCDVFNQRPDIERTRHDGQLDLFEDVGVPF